MSKIVFINTLYSPNIGGGAEIICQKQAELLAQEGFQVSVITTHDEKDIKQETINQVSVFRLPIRNFYWQYKPKNISTLKKLFWHMRDMYNFQAKKDVKNLLKEINPQHIFIHNLPGFSISIIDTIKKLKIPITQVLHDQYYLCTKSTMFKNNCICQKQCIECKTLRLFHKKKSNKIDTVVGVSSFILNKLVSNGYFKDSKKIVIHNSQNLPTPPKRKVWENDRTLKIGFIGSLMPNKGIEVLIQEFNKLKDYNIELYIAGKGDESFETRLKEIANNKTYFLGYQNAFDFYNSIDVCVIPSLWEDTFPGVAYEALSQGVVCIGSNLGGISEIINSTNGILINPYQKDAIKEAILNLYENIDYFQDLQNNSIQSIYKFANEKRMISEYLQIINN